MATPVPRPTSAQDASAAAVVAVEGDEHRGEDRDDEHDEGNQLGRHGAGRLHGPCRCLRARDEAIGREGGEENDHSGDFHAGPVASRLPTRVTLVPPGTGTAVDKVEARVVE